MTFRRQRYIPDSYSAPAIDSPRAQSNAVQRICGCTDKVFDALTPEQVAKDHRLSLKVADYLLGRERALRLRGASDGL